MSCVTCNCETKKYKCPSCLAFYCSVQCFKTHKELNSCNEVKIKPKEEVNRRTITHLPFKTEDTVDIDVLKKLEQSEELKQLLENPHLREYLKEIDSAPSAWKAIKIAMQEPIFLEFAEECLKVVEP